MNTTIYRSVCSRARIDGELASCYETRRVPMVKFVLFVLGDVFSLRIKYRLHPQVYSAYFDPWCAEIVLLCLG